MLGWALAAAVAGVALLTAGGFLDGRAFPGELLALFRLQYLFAAAGLAAAAALARRPRTTVVAALTAAVNALGLVPAVADEARPDPRNPELRLLVANLWYPGDHYARLVELVERERPDVVGLTELTPEWAAAIDEGLRDYRHRVLEPREGSYGLGLYSRAPLRNAYIVSPGGRGPPVARATIDAGAAAAELFLVHAPGVYGRSAAHRQRAFMSALAALAQAAGPRALVCGDLNGAPWSGPLRGLLERGSLQPADRWRPLDWSFPAWARPLGTPIDQCLAGEGVRVSTRTGPDFGSDHLPVLAEVEVP